MLSRVTGTLCGLLLAFASGAPCSAQSPPAEIILPSRLVAGQPATLAVADADGRLAANVVVEFSGGGRVTTDSTGRAIFKAPAATGVLIAQVPGTRAAGSATVVAPPQGLPHGVQITSAPRRILAHDRFAVSGSGFRGEAEANRASVAGRPALVLAASPVSVVLAPAPDLPPGPGEISVSAGGASLASVPVRVLALTLEPEKETLAPREKARLRVRVRGGSERLEVEIRNLAPEVVKLRGGEMRRMLTSGGEKNMAELEIEGRRAGEFAFRARLVPPPAGQPDTESAREQLLAARAVAPKEWHPRVDRVLRRLESGPGNAGRVQIELEKLLAQNPPGEFGILLEAAWRILLGR
jgi:hypothetical protein